MSIESIYIPSEDKKINVDVPKGIDGAMFDKIAEAIDLSGSEDARTAYKAIKAILSEVIRHPDMSKVDWGKVDITDQWRLMSDFVRPMLEKFLPEAGGATQGGTVPIPVGTQGGRRRPLPRRNRPRLSEASKNKDTS